MFTIQIVVAGATPSPCAMAGRAVEVIEMSMVTTTTEANSTGSVIRRSPGAGRPARCSTPLTDGRPRAGSEGGLAAKMRPG